MAFVSSLSLAGSVGSQYCAVWRDTNNTTELGDYIYDLKNLNKCFVVFQCYILRE